MTQGIYALVLLSTLMSCNDDEHQTDPRAVTLFGQEVAVGNGKARSFVEMDASGAATTVGFTLTKTALDNLPHHDDAYVLDLPTEKSRTPFDHIWLNWTSHGHSPDGVYDKPHFDMHFFMITGAERKAIQPGTAMQLEPETRFLPPNYLSPPGEGMAEMGKHWGDITAPELKGKPFTTTFVYGSYNKKVIFYEPMITRAWLLTQPDTLMTVPQPVAFDRAARYPTHYSVRFDKKTEIYTVSLAGLTQR